MTITTIDSLLDEVLEYSESTIEFVEHWLTPIRRINEEIKSIHGHGVWDEFQDHVERINQPCISFRFRYPNGKQKYILRGVAIDLDPWQLSDPPHETDYHYPYSVEDLRPYVREIVADWKKLVGLTLIEFIKSLRTRDVPVPWPTVHAQVKKEFDHHAASADALAKWYQRKEKQQNQAEER